MSEQTWQPSACLAALRQRAAFIAQIRRFFSERGYLEVETPTLARYGVTDAYLANIMATCRGQSYCLQTSPEYHMKRLLAAGSGPIFQLARVYRDDELGRWHNPEFTLLEWYQLGIDHHTLLQEVDELLQQILACPPLQVRTYQQAFLDTCHIDPFNTSVSALKAVLQREQLHQVLADDEQDIDQYLFLLMSHVVEPSFAAAAMPTAVVGFPPSQAALARVNAGVAARFEVYFRGVELANGFYELTDPKAQQARFQQDNQLRQSQGKPIVAADERLLQALAQGLPDCSGVALGIDRLLALAMAKSAIANAMAFDFTRA